MSKVVQFGEFTETRKNGEKTTFIVQTAPAEMTEEIVEFMTKFFMTREPLTQYTKPIYFQGVLGDPVSVEELQAIWRNEFPRGTSLAAFVAREGEKPKLIGVNALPIYIKGQKGDETFKGEPARTLINLLEKVSRMGKVYEKYGVDRYLSGMGLAVDVDYHGFNVGQRLLECRRQLCEHLGVQVTATVFTAPASQHIAKKVGFEALAELEYATYEADGEKPFASLPGKAIMMGLKF